MAKELVYVTYTCKKCGSAFLDVDINDNINELPLKTRHCPNCVAKGHKNEKMSKTLSKDKEREQFVKQKIKELNITEMQDIKFIKKYFKQQVSNKEKTGQKVYINNIFNNALEVLSYQSWKQ